ncbi:helix-turn-helix domain-containing protein [Janthinobacterium sp. Mn2066]|uniref:helix-turn-helix domain-containing protein n=1 Tax=Janthinobacterium sp. Mn2066 TaxID=3395264 RepID=UPI003BD388F2
MKTSEYLDAVKKALALPSDYAVSKVLGITRESVSALRNGKNGMGIETCMKIAEILQVDEHIVYADTQIERAKTPEMVNFWRSISEKFSMSFNSLLLGAGPRRISLLTR